MNNRVILFGGSFDPPHLGHLVMAQWVSEMLSESVCFLPTGNPPHKKTMSASIHRVEMLRLAVENNPNFFIDDYEAVSETVNYTVDTLKRYSRKYGLNRDNLFFILGSDSLNSLETWKNPQGVTELCTLVVAEREPIDEVF